MITYEEALEKARKYNPDITVCDEYEDAFIFDEEREEKILASPQVVILKENGEYRNFIGYITTDVSDNVDLDKPIKSYKIKNRK